ncbi:acetamidase/formamidase family protein [Salinibacterium sp. TMP30]|uniref:acetamidase/formamidase family protein n=1 Tax=Salinibacterium sp. TMP30 TaxID=3138237 RepID=UPI003138AF6C
MHEGSEEAPQMQALGHEGSSSVYTAQATASLTVAQGEQFLVKTPSILSRAGFEDADDFSAFSIPVIGPVAIEGVNPGDLVRIEIHKLDIAERGAMLTLPGRGGFSGEFRPFGHTMDIRNGLVYFEKDVTIPVRPMVGKLGFAPADDSPSSSTVGTFGGNMDCKDLVEGSTIFLTAQVAGGFLFVGDLHAVQGDGESSLTAVEVEGRVVMSCSVVGRASYPRPVILSGNYVITIGDGDDLDEAARLALDDMLALVQSDRGWEREKAAMLLSAVADVSISQLVNARSSVKVSLATEYFIAPPVLSSS